MQQQLPVPFRLMVLQVAMRVRRDVRVEEKGLAVFEDDVGVFDVRFPVPQRFDLGARQGHARLGLLQDEVVMKGLFVRRDQLLAGIRLGGHGPRILRDAVSVRRAPWGLASSGPDNLDVVLDNLFVRRH